MARYQCRACGFDGHALWEGTLICPHCGNRTAVRVAIGVEEMTAAEVAALTVTMPGGGDPRQD